MSEGRWQRRLRSSCLPEQGFLSRFQIFARRPASPRRCSPAIKQQERFGSPWIPPWVVTRLAGEQLPYRPVTLIDCLIRVGGCSSIGVRNRDASEGPACNVTRSLTLGPIGIP